MSTEFEKEVTSALATIIERQGQQHTAIVDRLDKVNGRLGKHDEKIDDLDAHKNKAIGIAIAISAVFGIIVVAYEYMQHMPHVKP